MRSPSTFLTLCCCASQLDFATSAGLEWLVTSPPDHDGYHDPGQASVPIDISDTSTLADDDRRGHSDVQVPAGWPAPMRNARKDFAATVVRRGDLFSDQVVVVGGWITAERWLRLRFLTRWTEHGKTCHPCLLHDRTVQLHNG
jgi:hypothetical protein